MDNDSGLDDQRGSPLSRIISFLANSRTPQRVARENIGNGFKHNRNAPAYNEKVVTSVRQLASAVGYHSHASMYPQNYRFSADTADLIRWLYSINDACWTHFSNGDVEQFINEYERSHAIEVAEPHRSTAPRNGNHVDTDLRQLPAAFRFRIQDGKIDVLPEQADAADFETAKDLYAELIAKANGLRSRLAATNADQRVQRSVERLLEALAARIEHIRPGVLLSRSRSIEADRNAFDTEEARRELFPDAIAMVDDVLLSLQDLLAIYPIVRKIEAERLALSIQRDATLLTAVRAELEEIKKEASVSEAVTEASRAALKENDPDIEVARTLDVLAGLLADQLLVVRNFGSVAVTYVRKHGASAAVALGAGLARAGSELKELGGNSWEAAKVNLPEGVGAAARILPVGLVIALLANIAGPVAGLAALSGGFKQLAKAINKLKNIGEPPKETKPKPEVARKPKSRPHKLFAVPETIVVPAGEFLMGSPDGQGDEHERPQHKVTIKKSFGIGIAPITRGEFASFVEATNYELDESPNSSWRSPGFDQEDDHPVVYVSWHDAKAYVTWLKEQSGKAFRLLSEAEWEYCCRAGTTTEYSTGDTITAEQAKFGRNSKGTTSVSKFPPNSWGLYDMHGNVWEWCEDNWHESYNGKPPSDGSVWRGGSRSLRVLRGGAWNNNPENLRSANRNRNQPDNRNNNVGFRVASTLCIGAGMITVSPGVQKAFRAVHDEQVGVRVEMGARYRGGACLGRRTGSGRRGRRAAQYAALLRLRPGRCAHKGRPQGSPLQRQCLSRCSNSRTFQQAGGSKLCTKNTQPSF
jgi:formylglycine-generating enzyme required for sulfatase activity